MALEGSLTIASGKPPEKKRWFQHWWRRFKGYTADDILRLKEAGIRMVEAEADLKVAEASKLKAEANKANAEAFQIRCQAIVKTVDAIKVSAGADPNSDVVLTLQSREMKLVVDERSSSDKDVPPNPTEHQE
jgi:hypothetical protein